MADPRKAELSSLGITIKRTKDKGIYSVGTGKATHHLWRGSDGRWHTDKGDDRHFRSRMDAIRHLAGKRVGSQTTITEGEGPTGKEGVRVEHQAVAKPRFITVRGKVRPMRGRNG